MGNIDMAVKGEAMILSTIGETSINLVLISREGFRTVMTDKLIKVEA